MNHARRHFLYRIFKAGAVLTAAQQAWAGNVLSGQTKSASAQEVQTNYPEDHPSHAGDISGAHVRTMTGRQPLHRALDGRVASVATLEDLRVLPTDRIEEGALVRVAGYHAPGDDGGGLFALVTDLDVPPDDIIHVMAAGKKLWRRCHQGFFTSAQAGIKRDGTREDEVLQKAINTAFDYKLRFHLSRGAHTHGGMILIPHDVVITGCGKHESYFYNDFRNAGQRGVIVGTYGPANSYIPAYHPQHVYGLSHTDNHRIYVKNSQDFKVGDIIGIEGTRRVRDTNLHSPNQINEVTSVHEKYIVARYYIDDDYDGGRVIRLNQPELPEGDTFTDATGRQWNLHVSVNTSITNVGFRQKAGFRWPAVNLSTYKTVFENCSFGSMEGYTAVSGNPVARTVFKDCEFFYSRNAWEFAYYSHDTEVINPTILRVKSPPSNVGDYICHANTSEGAKRIHINGGQLNDGGPSDKVITMLQTGPESSIRNFTITTFGRGVWGDSYATMSGCTIIWKNEFGIAGFSHGYANDNIVVSQKDSSGHAILVDRGTFKNNVLRSVDGARRRCDVLQPVNRHTLRTDENDNNTFKSTPVYYSSYSNSLPVVNGRATIGLLELAEGTIEQDSIISYEMMIEIPDSANIDFLLNDQSIHTIQENNRVIGIHGKIVFASGKGMDNKHCRLFLTSSTGQYLALPLNAGVAWPDVKKFEIQVFGLSEAQSIRRHYVRMERNFS